jgi:hypothetical protein
MRNPIKLKGAGEVPSSTAELQLGCVYQLNCPFYLFFFFFSPAIVSERCFHSPGTVQYSRVLAVI